jgi:hypothetical protein
MPSEASMNKNGVFEIHKTQIGLTAGFVAAAALVTSVVVLTSMDHYDRSRDIRDALDSCRAKNVFLFIGDGMGDSEITIARNYRAGAVGRLRMDSLPFTGAYTTYALQEASPSLVDYVTDSAASGTGWATGRKTSNGRISTVAGTGNSITRLTTILELAQRAGFKTGNVSTAELTDATPAVLNAHVNDRVQSKLHAAARPTKGTADPDPSPSNPSITTSTCPRWRARTVPIARRWSRHAGKPSSVRSDAGIPGRLRCRHPRRPMPITSRPLNAGNMSPSGAARRRSSSWGGFPGGQSCAFESAAVERALARGHDGQGPRSARRRRARAART